MEALRGRSFSRALPSGLAKELGETFSLDVRGRRRKIARVEGSVDEQRSARARLISQSGWSGYDRLP